MIRFENVSKIFDNAQTPAVDNLNLHIPKGEICVLIGPSGCGKTTVLKLINRLLEKTSGEIYIDGVLNTEMDVINLRLNMGYVIQNIGLFPHMNIKDNVSTVLRELKWDKDRISERVDELLTLVNLNPDIYKTRKPHQLSGGQQQRVGVARAMAANPNVLLMDEPFGAADPITRVRLQNELLELQKKLHKTIIMVTHDIDEAIKMGDSIAIMRGGKLIQHTTPTQLLKQPANEFVEDLIGKNRSIKQLDIAEVYEHVSDSLVPRLKDTQNVSDGLAEIKNSKTDFIVIENEQNKFLGVVYKDDLNLTSSRLGNIVKPVAEHIPLDSNMKDALAAMMNTGEYYTIVLNERNEFVGIVTLEDIFKVAR